jgi:hypothetical protein
MDIAPPRMIVRGAYCLIAGNARQGGLVPARH